jgi:hypothetical protein
VIFGTPPTFLDKRFVGLASMASAPL